MKLDPSKIEELEKYMSGLDARSNELFLKGKDKSKDEREEQEYIFKAIDELSPFFSVTVPK